MKKNRFNIVFSSILVLSATLYACKKTFLERAPLGTLDETTLATNAGVQGLLIGAYAQLDGFSGAGSSYYAGPSNWAFAGVASDDAYKGSDAGDQSNEANPIETYTVTATNWPVASKWAAMYDGVTRSNDVLRIMAKAADITDDDKKNIEAQARFLRGHYHFELRRTYKYVPYIDESVTYSAGNYNVSNVEEIWSKIEDDFKAAVAGLPETQDAVGRANKSAAKAYLAKVYMYQQKYAEAKALYDDIIVNGQTSKGVKYALVQKFADNFNAETENNSESIFALQSSVNDGSGGANASQADVLNFPYNNGTGDMPGGCCGFYQPTQDLVNAYRVDASGLPLLDSWFSKDVKNDQNIKSSEPFTIETDPLDPRLDWTVGRRGIPYLDWGKHPGQIWIRDQPNGGPYSPVKNIYYKSQAGKLTDVSFWTSGVIAANINIIRFADVLLMAAEAEVELNNLEKARGYVNMVRSRAANPVSWVPGSPATYKLTTYPAFSSQEYARKAVRFERRLELAMEGHRFFDLVRWGIAEPVLNAYIAREKGRRTYLANAKFTAPKNNYYPVPQGEIDNSGGALQQNPDY